VIIAETAPSSAQECLLISLREQQSFVFFKRDGRHLLIKSRYPVVDESSALPASLCPIYWDGAESQPRVSTIILDNNNGQRKRTQEVSAATAHRPRKPRLNEVSGHSQVRQLERKEEIGANHRTQSALSNGRSQRNIV
jgi:hypothetical protein